MFAFNSFNNFTIAQRTENVCIAYVFFIKLKSLSQKNMKHEKFLLCAQYQWKSTWTFSQRFFFHCDFFSWKIGQKIETHRPKRIPSIQLACKQFDRIDCRDKCELFVPWWLAVVCFPLHYTCWCLLLKSVKRNVEKNR